ncbi:hypothetical protein ATANTOWER_026179 [Ataeniobius toweri]|uniref:Uncharacterized protein n=1 Tax=Ataeniobius toweri TaxID=208326 RepID=A0ABU7AUY7_9TELE|nr:hypothetical protein [Ataeniobius toweri]
MLFLSRERKASQLNGRCMELIQGDPGRTSKSFSSFTLNIQPDVQWIRVRSNHVHALEWPSQSPDLNTVDNIWQGHDIDVHLCSLANLTGPEQRMEKQISL